jgi:benzoyl-CoA reductase/2-hydroxyglutaryl-CoA dehydratase subunit BcrC/BadD/HgdB
MDLTFIILEWSIYYIFFTERALPMFDREYAKRNEEKVFTEGVKMAAEGAKVVGVYCAFTPGELIAAAGALPVSLCAGSSKPIEDAEKHLPKNLCPLVKASYGFALTGTCPYFDLVDYLFADATCDGKKKMFELLGRIKPLHVLQLPQTYQTEESVLIWLREIGKMKEILEEITGNTVTEHVLRKQIRLFNSYRNAIMELFELNRHEFPMLYGMEIYNIIEARGSIVCNLDKRVAELKEAIIEAKERAADRAFVDEIIDKPRILLTGCPSTNTKLLELIEESGGVVVAMENCGGLKTAESTVDEDIEPMLALAEYYVKTACPCMSPNQRRLNIIGNIIKNYRVDGVVELTWQACHTYNIEAYLVNNFVKDYYDKPYIQIETTYSESDIEQIRVRIEAFLELLQSKAV